MVVDALSLYEICDTQSIFSVARIYYLIILPLLSTLVNHTKTILVQNLVFCMISKDSGMQCSDFLLPFNEKNLNFALFRNYIGLPAEATSKLTKSSSQLIDRLEL